MRRKPLLLAAVALAALLLAPGCKFGGQEGGGARAKPSSAASVRKFTPLTWHRILEPEAGAQTLEELLAHYGGTQPEGVEFVRGAKEQFQPQVYFALEKAPVITSDDITRVGATDEGYGPAVDFTLTPEAGERFRRFTREHIGVALAVVMDHEVITNPRINSEIGDRGIISGNFTRQEVDDLVERLRK